MPVEPPSFVVPLEDLGVSAPPIEEAVRLAAGNRALLSNTAAEFCGVPLAEARRRFRRDAAAAVEPVRTALDPGGSGAAFEPGTPWIATGHQPSLFHPGVWLKHRYVRAAAGAARGCGVSFVTDHDQGDGGILRYPPGPGAFQAAAGKIRLLEREEIPWEETPAPEAQRIEEARREIRERSALDKDGLTQIDGFFASWGRAARERQDWTGAIIAARAEVEARLGFPNVEIRMSRLAGLPAFGVFLGAILGRARAFAEAFNEAVRTFRSEHKVRSRSHPFPDLIVERGRVEVPFWAFRAGGLRERLFLEGGRPEALRSPAGIELEWRRPPWEDEAAAADFLAQAAARGIRLRPRAVTTTLFFRLVACDLFIHGAGGARYDRVTDRVLRDFWRLEPPAYAAVTGTLFFRPLEGAGAASVGEGVARVRRFSFSPETFLEGDAGAVPLAAEKRRLVSDRPPESQRRKANFLRVHEINRTLFARIPAERIAAAEAATADARAASARRLALTRRDYPFFLYPERRIREFLARIG